MGAKLGLTRLGTQVLVSKTKSLLPLTSKPSAKSQVVAISKICQVRFGFKWPVVIRKIAENKQQKVISYVHYSCLRTLLWRGSSHPNRAKRLRCNKVYIPK